MGEVELVSRVHQSSAIGDVAVPRLLLEREDEICQFCVGVTDADAISCQRHRTAVRRTQRAYCHCRHLTAIHTGTAVHVKYSSSLHPYYRAMLCVTAVSAVGRCPSVRLTVTFVYCIQMAKKYRRTSFSARHPHHSRFLTPSADTQLQWKLLQRGQ